MVTIQFKRANRSYLESQKQPFASGEPLYEQNTGKMKIGDGVHLYKDLPYIGQIEDVEIQKYLTSVYKFKGSVNSFEELPINANNGDTYNVNDSGMNYSAIIDDEGNLTWDALGSTVDLSEYLKINEINVMTEEEVNALFD